MKYLLCLGFLVGVLAFAGTKSASAQCVVQTEGGVLNVRATPDGRVIAKLDNGTPVTVIAHRDHPTGVGYSRIRARRRSGGAVTGWVTEIYIHCP